MGDKPISFVKVVSCGLLWIYCSRFGCAVAVFPKNKKKKKKKKKKKNGGRMEEE